MPTNSFPPVTSEYSNRTDWLFNMLGVDWEVCNCSSRHGKHENDDLFVALDRRGKFVQEYAFVWFLFGCASGHEFEVSLVYLNETIRH